MQGVVFDPPSVVFPPTYITDVSRFAVKVENTSDDIHKISLFSYASTKQDVFESNFMPESPRFSHRDFLFKHETFSIEPLEFELFPHSSTVIIVEFHPGVASKYEVPAYIQIDEREKRKPFSLTGIGLPPFAYFIPEIIAVGNLDLDSVNEYEIVLKNEGNVPVDFELENKKTVCQYMFTPRAGTIPINQSMFINVKFIGTTVGAFSDTFVFHVKGATYVHPKINFNGKVVSPPYNIFPRRIDFGPVGYGFLYTSKITIENKSQITFDYKLRVGNAGSFERREFQIIPASGTISKDCKQEVEIEFIPFTIQKYNVPIILDIVHYQDNLVQIPITASCTPPKVTVLPETLDFEEIFIGYQYTKTILINNASEFPIKFEFSYQEFPEKIGMIQVSKETGIVEPTTKAEFNISYTGFQVGPAMLDAFITVSGSVGPPIIVKVKANVVGPSLTLSTNNITFGNIQALSKVDKKVTITNHSLIPANFEASFEPEVKVFSVEPSQGVIAPNESMTFDVSAKLTDILTFASNLKFNFEHLKAILIPIRANGMGTPVKSSIDMETIDLGLLLSDSPITTSFSLTNHSDRQNEIRWTNQKPQFEGVKFTDDIKSDFTYSIQPEFCQINPHKTQEFVISLKCRKVLSFTMKLSCNATIGRNRSEIYSPILKGSFFNPILALSSYSLEFKEDCLPIIDNRKDTHPSTNILKPISQVLTLTNRSKVPLKIIVECPDPFTCSQNNIDMESGEVTDLNITFDPRFKTDFVSEIVTKKVCFRIEDHPQKIFLVLKGIINFPNLTFSSQEPIDFGIAMMNTEQSKTIQMTNVFQYPLRYEWELISENDNDQVHEEDTSEETKSSKVFDIFPLRGQLEPNSTMDTHFEYFALSNLGDEVQTFRCIAVCHVVGGPDYQFHLTGSSTSIHYEVQPTSFDIAEINFAEEVSQRFKISNSSNVPLNYSIRIPKKISFKKFSVYPESAVIDPKQSQSILVKIIPGLPQNFQEYFIINIGGFEDIQFKINLKANFSQTSLPLPRLETDTAYVNVLSIQKHKSDLEKTQKNNLKFLNEEEKQVINMEEESLTPNDVPIGLLLNEEKKLLLEQLLTIKNSSLSPAQENAKLNSFYTAQYVLDFGDLILGEDKNETVEITNQASFPISFDINTDKLKFTGFKIDPCSFKDIQAHLTVSVEVNFNAMNRKINDLGPVSYNIPFIFSDNHRILLILKAVLNAPEITFSNLHFDFGEVIVGQTKIMTLQLQNTSFVNCEFQFGNPEPMNLIQKRSARKSPSKKVFSVVPDNGILHPSSFMNIAIHFSPDSERSCQMQFPVMLKHALTPYYITVDGRGALLQLLFDPSELFLRPVQPFSEPSYCEIKITNPTNYSIDFYSPQFDKDLYEEENNDPRQFESPFVTYSPNTRVSTGSYQFSMCIIVSGPPLSGKTTVSKHLSELYNLPIIDFENIIKSVKENKSIQNEENKRNTNTRSKLQNKTIEESNPPGHTRPGTTTNANDTSFSSVNLEYQHALHSILSKDEYKFGCIIDGLTFSDETTNKDNDTMINQCMKIKNINEEIGKFIPPVIPHQQMSSYEKALDIILSALNGQYVFHIALKTTYQTSESRRIQREKHEQSLIRRQALEEREKLFNMTENDYEVLPEEEKELVDGKRKDLRGKYVETEEEPANTSSNKNSRSRSQARSGRKSARQNRSPGGKGDQIKRKGKSFLSDPIDQAIYLYALSLGSLIQKLQSTDEKFKCIDPIEILGNNDTTIAHQSNTVVVNGDDSLDTVFASINSFLPPLKVLKEAAFKILIPEPVIRDIPKSVQLIKKPDFFSIIPDGINPGDEDIATTFLTSHWKLEPKSDLSLKVQYRPYNVGDSDDFLLFELTSSTSPSPKLRVHGQCSYPHINTQKEIMFSKVIQKFDPKQLPAFILDTNEFNFGYVLATKDKKSKDPFPYRANIKLLNATDFPCELTAIITDPNLKNIWNIDQAEISVPASQESIQSSNSSENITIPETSDSNNTQLSSSGGLNPKQTELSIGFNPTNVGLYKATLLLTIKDNPDPIYINLSGESFLPQVEVSASNLDFDKVLLNDEKSKIIELNNPGKLNAYWRLKGISSISNVVSFNQTEGIIKSKAKFKIVVKLHTSKPQQLKKTIQIEIMDELKTKAFKTESIALAADIFDVNFDLNYPKNENDQIDFGQIKVGDSKTIQMSMRNRGKYPLNYKFTITNSNASKYLTISPMEGTSPINDKGTQITLNFKALKVANFKNCQAFNLKIIETQTHTVTTVLNFSFNAKCYYNTFTLSCGKQLDLGVMTIGNTIKKDFVLTNTGSFPFEFEFHNKSSPIEEVKGKARAKSRSRSKTKQASILTFGRFTITPFNGLLTPNVPQQIFVEYSSSEPGISLESLSLLVPDVSPHDSNYTLQCKAEAIQPVLNMTDNDKIFPKLPLIMRDDLLKKDITSYLEDEKTLHFSSRAVNQQESITLCLINPQPLECVVNLSIKPKTKVNAFEVKDKTLTIPGNKSCKTTITFSPTSNELFSSTFVATIKSQLPSPEFKFDMEGTGAVPHISLKTILDQSENGYSVNFGRTLVGTEKKKIIDVSNNTHLNAMLNVSANATADFEIIGIDSAKPFELEAGRVFQFIIVHKPQKPRKSQFDIVVEVLENPESNIHISSSGEGFSEDVIFEGLNGEENELRFKDVIVGRAQSVSFLMKNISDSTIRFNWSASNDITFSPKIGHLKKKQSKEIIASFFTEKPTKYNGAKGACQITKIEIIEQQKDEDTPNTFVGDWDDSMKVVSFVHTNEVESNSPRRQNRGENAQTSTKPGRMVKVTNVVPEPAYRVLPDTKPRDLPIKIFAISDNIKCTLDTHEISFLPTMMYQNRIAEVKLTNTCGIRFKYEWELEKFESLRTDYALTRPPAFSIDPPIGFIESGESQVFSVTFSPKEVDDFICLMKCNIPYMNQKVPLKLNINGFSRRPVCHFNIVVSDYLTRRHPDYTYPLPDNVKVLEIISKSVNVRGIKKIEIINPTSNPYDAIWTLISDNSNNSIQIDNKHALVSSGKQYTWNVSFSAISPKLVESLWEFSIPNHNIKIPFLFVGKISLD